MNLVKPVQLLNTSKSFSHAKYSVLLYNKDTTASSRLVWWSEVLSCWVCLVRTAKAFILFLQLYIISSGNGFNLLLYLSVYQNLNVNNTNGSVDSKDWQELRLGLSVHRQSKSSDTSPMVVSVFNHGSITRTRLVSFIISLSTSFSDLFIKFPSRHYFR